MKSLACLALVAGFGLAPAAFADTPSFNYVQLTGQHVNASALDGWGWGAEASFNPAGGWMLSANYRRANHIGGSADALDVWHADAGYAFEFADTMSLYGKVGLAKRTFGASDDSGAHYEGGLRVRLPLVQLEGGVGRFQVDGGYNEYSATALFHVFPFTYVTVGYITDRQDSTHVDRWQAGLRLTF